MKLHTVAALLLPAKVLMASRLIFPAKTNQNLQSAFSNCHQAVKGSGSVKKEAGKMSPALGPAYFAESFPGSSTRRRAQAGL